jgi:hypothetical protein
MTVQLIQHIQQSNELEQLGKPQPITVGGVEAPRSYVPLRLFRMPTARLSKSGTGS